MVDKYIGRDKPSSFTFNVRYLVIGFKDQGNYGTVWLYDSEDMTNVYTINGTSSARDLGRTVEIKMEKI